MKQFIGVVLAFGFACCAWGKDCTLSNEFRVARPQVLAGVLEDPSLLPLPGVKLELIGGGDVEAAVVTNSRGEYSFADVPAGSYRIHIRLSGNPFCAPGVQCNQEGCSIKHAVTLNPKNKPEVVY